MTVLQHQVKGTFPIRVDRPCPDCDGRLTMDEVLVPQEWVHYFERRTSLARHVRLRVAVFCVCSGCEFAMEVRA